MKETKLPYGVMKEILEFIVADEEITSLHDLLGHLEQNAECFVMLGGEEE